MTAYLVECPACHVSFPVHRETMRVAGKPASVDDVLARIDEVLAEPESGRCQSPSCGCNRPEPAA